MNEKDLKQAKRFILTGLKKQENKSINFKKLKIELSENNERIFREIYQFIQRNSTFEKFINDWIAQELLMNGFE